MEHGGVSLGDDASVSGAQGPPTPPAATLAAGGVGRQK
ncbi:hypothetical protein NH44784_031601 [Achromobacter xylosoxidans NH44784-1996]|nr:hypothetical protein NH44784_031601 [Achromobacter xylosoxidans NH44784-1996]